MSCEHDNQYPQTNRALGMGLVCAGEVAQLRDVDDTGEIAAKMLERGHWPVVVHVGDCIPCAQARWRQQDDILQRHRFRHTMESAQ